METQIISEITHSKGTTSTYFDVIFGNVKKKNKIIRPTFKHEYSFRKKESNWI